MFNDKFDFQYDSCVARGICSLNPRTSALQTIFVLYLRLFAKFCLKLDQDELLDFEIKKNILNIIAITVYNQEFNENIFMFLINELKAKLDLILDLYKKHYPNENIESELKKKKELFDNTQDIIQSIKYGEIIFQKVMQEIPSKIRDLYNIMLVIIKSLAINISNLISFDKNFQEGFNSIFKSFGQIDIGEQDIQALKTNIQEIANTDVLAMKRLRKVQEDTYGLQNKVEVSFSTVPNKAILVVGSNIKELEIILENLKNTSIDVYSHDDMMLAHTFPKFSEYKNFKGQYGQGLENCLLDFATFPGPIILTKNSLHNIQNFYRGLLFTTDKTCPKGVISIKNNDFSEVIEAANESKGFKTGKNCESIEIGYNFENICAKLDSIFQKEKYKNIFFIGLDGHSLEQKSYFEKLIKHANPETLIISFSYKSDSKKIFYTNSCFDSHSLIRFYDYTQKYNCQNTIFIPKCDRNSISQMIYLKEKNNTQVFVGKCAPIILNPSLMHILHKEFNIKPTGLVKDDLKEIYAS